MATKPNKRKKKNKGTTIVGALSMTGPSIHQNPGAPGGKITRANHKVKTRKAKKSTMTVAESLGDLGDSTHSVGP